MLKYFILTILSFKQHFRRFTFFCTNLGLFLLTYLVNIKP